jgi:hypothetical protein
MARERKGKTGGRTGFAAAPPCRERKGGRRRKEGETEADRWDPPVGAAEKKKRRGKGSGPAGNSGLGCLGRKGKDARFFFLFFFFSNLIFKSNFNSNSNQTFANFSQIFYRIFRDYSSNQNHASQMMMHIHLLFLTLLYYL